MWRSTTRVVSRGVRAADRWVSGRLCRYHPASGAPLIGTSELVALPLELARAGSAGGPEGTTAGAVIGTTMAVGVGLYMMVRC